MKTFTKTVLGAFLGTIIALLVLMLFCVGIANSVAALTTKESPKIPSSNAILKVACQITEQSVENFTFNPLSSDLDMSTTLGLYKAVKAIENAATDPAIKILYLSTDDMAISLSTAEELRAAIEKFRLSGKPVISYSKNLSSGSYYLASVADKVVVNTYADMLFSGTSMTMLFFKDLADKLGVDIQLVRHGKYKSAVEPYLRNDISKENREQYECLLNTVWKTMAESVASSRKFTAEEYTGWVENLQISGPVDAKEKGMIDEIWYQDELEEYFCSVCGVENAKDLNVVSLEDYAFSKVRANIRAKEKIAVIYANGEIVSGQSDKGYIGEDFAAEIKRARKDSSVKAVVFRVNSPGGSVQASGIIAREIELLKAEKPVIASYGDYAASGGYWISCESDKIFTDRTTLTGSIGVFGIVPSVGRAIKKNLLINTVELSTTKHGSLISGILPLDQEELDWMQNLMENIYVDFTGRVAKGRGMTVEAVDEIGQGRVWTGADALGIGLVDQIGSLQDAIDYAAAANDMETYQVVEYPVQKTIVEKLMEMFTSSSVKVKTPAIAESIVDGLKWLGSIEKPEIMARMEVVPELKY